MANPTCNATTLVTDAAAYRLDSDLNPKQQKCLEIYAKVLELAAIGGTDYTAALATTLLQDAATLEIGFSPDEIRAAQIAVAFANAAAAGATVPASINTKLANLGLLVQADDLLLDKALTLLKCKLGVHKAYPQ